MFFISLKFNYVFSVTRLIFLCLIVIRWSLAFLPPTRQGSVQHGVGPLHAGRKGLAAGGVIAENKKVRSLYEFDYHLEAGIVLTGTEVKACRQGNAIISDGHVDVRAGEAWLFNVHIGTYDRSADRDDHLPKRDRKLLLHHNEILKAEQRVLQKNYEIVPLKLVFSDKNFIKVQLGVGYQKSVIDKRDDIKKKEAVKDARRAMKGMY